MKIFFILYVLIDIKWVFDLKACFQLTFQRTDTYSTNYHEICKSLYCIIPEQKLCHSIMALDGTPCGTKMVGGVHYHVMNVVINNMLQFFWRILYRIIINISTNTQCTREYIHCIMVQVCKGGECVHSDHGLDLPGKTDNISRSGGQNTMYSQYKKQSHVFYWTIQLLLLSLIIRKCNSTCDRFLLLQNLLSLYPCLCDILLSITCIPSPALL